MQLVYVLLGGSLLIWGRKLFFLFVAAAGFMAGLNIASRLISGPAWVGIAVGIVFAIGAALLAVFLQKVAVGVGGFLMGGYLLGSLGGVIGMDQGLAYWGLFLVGGIGGALLISLFFDLTLIWLSALAGAVLIMDVTPLTGMTRTLVLIGILFVGVIIQSSQWKKEDD